MNQQRIHDNYTDFQNALKRLEEALKEDISNNKVAVDGTIKRFEFTYELAWKLTKRILNYSGVEADSPRMVIKEAFQKKLIQEGNVWISMLEDRNKTTHIYDEKEALKIYESIKNIYFPLLKSFAQDIQTQIPQS